MPKPNPPAPKIYLVDFFHICFSTSARRDCEDMIKTKWIAAWWIRPIL